MEILLVPLGTAEVGFDEASTYKVHPAEIRPAMFNTRTKTRGLRKMKRLSPLMPEKLSNYEIDPIAIIIRLRQGSSSGSRGAICAPRNLVASAAGQWPQKGGM